MPPLIEAEELVKRYGDLVAVDGVDFEIQPGECFGFLGPNGAGKTSTMKMIACVSPVTAGRLTVFGMDVGSHPKDIKARIGVVSQADSLDPDLSVIQNLMAHARYFDLPKSVALQALIRGIGTAPASGQSSEPPGRAFGRHEAQAADCQGVDQPTSNARLGRAYDRPRSPGRACSCGRSSASSSHRALPCCSPHTTWTRRLTSATDW